MKEIAWRTRVSQYLTITWKSNVNVQNPGGTATQATQCPLPTADSRWAGLSRCNRAFGPTKPQTPVLWPFREKRVKPCPSSSLLSMQQQEPGTRPVVLKSVSNSHGQLSFVKSVSNSHRQSSSNLYQIHMGSRPQICIKFTCAELSPLETIWDLRIVFFYRTALVTQSCLTLWDPPGSSVPGILQTRILEWVAIPSSKGSSQPRDWMQVSCTAGRFFTVWATREAPLSTASTQQCPSGYRASWSPVGTSPARRKARKWC